MANTRESVMARVVTGDGCWEWQGCLSEGYGRVSFEGRYEFVHRLLWRWHYGSIPQGKEIHHRCENRRCCNPLHLEAITRQEHVHRSATIAAINARKTHCPHGHPLDEVNSLIRLVNGRPERHCHICLKEAYRRKYQKEKAQIAILREKAAARRATI